VRWAGSFGLAVAALILGWVARGRWSPPAPADSSPKSPVAFELPSNFWIEMQTQRAMLHQVQATCEGAARVDRPVPKEPNPAHGTASAHEESPEAVRENPAPMAAVRSLVDSAVASGKWTDRDVLAFRASMAEMSLGQKEQALRFLMKAMNEQGLRSTSGGPPF
jgi:hypothetical protein